MRQRNTIYDGRFEVPTFEEVIALTRKLGRELGRPIGLYPETKHPTYFRSIGLPSVEDVERMVEVGVLYEGARVELIDTASCSTLTPPADAPPVGVSVLLGPARRRPRARA